MMKMIIKKLSICMVINGKLHSILPALYWTVCTDDHIWQLSVCVCARVSILSVYSHPKSWLCICFIQNWYKDFQGYDAISPISALLQICSSTQLESKCLSVHYTPDTMPALPTGLETVMGVITDLVNLRAGSLALFLWSPQYISPHPEGQ